MFPDSYSGSANAKALRPLITVVCSAEALDDVFRGFEGRNWPHAAPVTQDGYEERP